MKFLNIFNKKKIRNEVVQKLFNKAINNNAHIFGKSDMYLSFPLSKEPALSIRGSKVNNITLHVPKEYIKLYSKKYKNFDNKLIVLGYVNKYYSEFISNVAVNDISEYVKKGNMLSFIIHNIQKSKDESHYYIKLSTWKFHRDVKISKEELIEILEDIRIFYGFKEFQK